MKKYLITLSLVLLITLSFATNYYVDATNGNDNNSGKTAENAWQTIEKVNGSNLVTGDSVLFKRGEIFRGNLLPKSGSALGNITYGAYGTGSKPKLFGSIQLNSLSDWINEGGNIWHNSPKVLNSVGAELLPNPDFNTDLSGWYAWNNAANGASTALSRTTVAGEYYTSPGGGKLICVSHGTELTDIQLMINNCSITSGIWYKFIFKAKASQQFLIPSGNIKLFQNVSPYKSYSLSSSKQAPITTSWATYEMYYKSNTTATDARVCFYLGNIIPNGTTFYFDSLSFKELDRDPGLISVDVGNIIFDNDSFCGIKVKNETDLNAQGKFWYDQNNFNLKIYSVSNPASFYTSIEIALTLHLIDESDKSYITYESLDLRYGAAHGIGGINTHHILIKDLDFSWIGGGFQPGLVEVRFGNGVEFWCAAHDNIVERCTFNQIYDAALTSQGLGSPYEAYNIYFRNNIVRNSEYSYEFWGYPTDTYLHDIYFENNTCLYAGYGWGHIQRPDPNGTHLMFFGNNVERINNIYIRNNIFYESSNYGARYNDIESSDKLIVDYNSWYESSGSVALMANTYYDYSTQWTAYQKASGQDAHSIHANPLLNPDYTLTKNSPCINSGTVTIAVSEDFNLTPRPQSENYDIGAFESNFSCIGNIPDRPDTIIGGLNVCQGVSSIYSVAAVSGANDYTWKLPEGWTGMSKTNSITATAGTNGGIITLTANNGCGSSTAKTLSVTVNPIPATPVITMNNGILHSNATNGNQWYFKNQIIPNATNASYVPLLKSFYYVVVTLNGCPSESSNIIWVNPAGIDETVDNNGINVYPNPTTGLVKIILINHFNSDYSVDIYDNVSGLLQTLKKSKPEVSFDLDLGKYSTGVYLIHIYNSDSYFQTKVIKR